MVSINGIFADSLWETESKYKYKKHFLWTLKKVSLAIFDSLNFTGTCTFTMDLKPMYAVYDFHTSKVFQQSSSFHTPKPWNRPYGG